MSEKQDTAEELLAAIKASDMHIGHCEFCRCLVVSDDPDEFLCRDQNCDTRIRKGAKP